MTEQPFDIGDEVHIRDGCGLPRLSITVARVHDLDAGSGNWWFEDYEGNEHPCRKFEIVTSATDNK